MVTFPDELQNIYKTIQRIQKATNNYNKKLQANYKTLLRTQKLQHCTDKYRTNYKNKNKGQLVSSARLSVMVENDVKARFRWQISLQKQLQNTTQILKTTTKDCKLLQTKFKQLQEQLQTTTQTTTKYMKTKKVQRQLQTQQQQYDKNYKKTTASNCDQLQNTYKTTKHLHKQLQKQQHTIQTYYNKQQTTTNNGKTTKQKPPSFP